MLSPRAIALQGVGAGILSFAMQGFVPALSSVGGGVGRPMPTVHRRSKSGAIARQNRYEHYAISRLLLAYYDDEGQALVRALMSAYEAGDFDDGPPAAG